LIQITHGGESLLVLPVPRPQPPQLHAQNSSPEKPGSVRERRMSTTLKFAGGCAALWMLSSMPPLNNLGFVASTRRAAESTAVVGFKVARGTGRYVSARIRISKAESDPPASQRQLTFLCCGDLGCWLLKYVRPASSQRSCQRSARLAAAARVSVSGDWALVAEV
jgi:hypothetical protein